MDANLRQLRKEAYKLWGISTKEVVYNTPKLMTKLGKDKFRFRINYSSEFSSWPRAYKLSLPHFEEEKLVSTETYARMIMPIILYKDFEEIQITAHAWYDMPAYLHANIIELVNQTYTRKLTLKQKIANLFLPRWYRFKKKVLPEDYIFEVSQLDNDEKLLVVKVKL